MKKAGSLLLMLVILGGWVVKDSEAAQWCWQFESDSDFYLKLTVLKPDPLSPFWSLNGMWYAQGLGVFPLVGTMVKSADGKQRILTLFGTATQGYPQSFRAEIDAETKDGSLYSYDFDEGIPAVPSIINRVKCSTLPAP